MAVYILCNGGVYGYASMTKVVYTRRVTSLQRSPGACWAYGTASRSMPSPETFPPRSVRSVQILGIGQGNQHLRSTRHREQGGQERLKPPYSRPVDRSREHPFIGTRVGLRFTWDVRIVIL